MNPFATITALAERTMDILAKRHKWVIDESRNGPLDLFGEPKTALPMTPDIQDANRLIQSNSTGAGVRFTEIMEGHIHVGEDIGDFQAAERVAKGRSSAARFYLSVDAFNVNDCKWTRPKTQIVTLTPYSDPTPRPCCTRDWVIFVRGTVKGPFTCAPW